ncbi:hypothetical protein JCM10449v2_006244 [Rhodotorula kratochvilovae]
MGPPPPLPSGLAAAPSRPLPHFTAPPSLRPSRAPLPAAQQPLSASSRPARKESLRAQGRDSEGVAMDGRGFLEAALENRRLAGVPLPTASAGARPLREVQPTLQDGRDELVRVGQAHEAHVGTWEDQAGADDQYEETEVLRGAPPNQDDVALTMGKVDLSRMTSTRRYMAELDEDDDPVGAEGDRATWHSAAWESEARDSVASLEPLQQAGLGRGLKGRSRLGPPRDSTLTTGSVDADPFSYSEEAKRAIALARSKSQRAVAGRDFALDEEDERDTSVEELRTVRDEAPRESDDFLDAYAGEEEEQSPASIHFPQFAPPPSVSAYSASEYRDSTTQYASYAPNEPPQPLYDTPSSLAPSSHPLSPVTPAPFLLSPSSPVPSSFSHSTFSPDPTTSQAFSPPPPSPPRQRKVLRKPRPPAARDKAASQAMGRSLSASSSTPSEPAKKEGVWSRFRARSRSRGASERPDPGLWAQERPPVPPMLHAHSSPLLVSDLSASLPALSSRFLASPSPSSRAGSPASTPASHSPIPTPSSAPLSQAEFARLAARPAFPHRGASARSAPEAEWVLKSVEGARTVQAGMAPAGGGARAVVVHRGAPELAQLVDDEVEHLSEALAQARTGEHPQGHDRAPSGAQSLYSNYSFYSLPQSASPTSSAPPASPAPASPAPTSSAPASAPALAPAPTQGHVTRQPSTLSTLQKLDFAIASGGGASRPSVVGRTASGKEIRRDPVTPDDYLQLGIDLHERGELERAAWCFEQSARRNGGCGAGMLMYGLSLRHGWGCQVNAQLGFRFLQMAAESVVADLDRVVFGGRTLSEAEANTKAAKSELVLALHEIGASYRFGWGVEKSKKMAVSYFKLAADLGDVDAQQDLAFALANGKGCKKDLKEAARYYRLAIAQGASDFGLSWVWKDKYLDA